MKAAGVVRRERRAIPGLTNDETVRFRVARSFRLQDKPHIPRRANAVIDLGVDIMIDENKSNSKVGKNQSITGQIVIVMSNSFEHRGVDEEGD